MKTDKLLAALDKSDIQSWDVRWYKKHGRFPRRITKDRNGKEFVIGDWSWNRKYRNYTQCPHCGKPMSEAFEEVDAIMTETRIAKDAKDGK